jgi:hypothetical protein
MIRSGRDRANGGAYGIAAPLVRSSDRFDRLRTVIGAGHVYL